MITAILIILGVLVVFAVGFFSGVRYCASDRVLPGLLARMSTERLNELAAQAGTIRTRISTGPRIRRSPPEPHVDAPVDD